MEDDLITTKEVGDYRIKRNGRIYRNILLEFLLRNIFSYHF